MVLSVTAVFVPSTFGLHVTRGDTEIIWEFPLCRDNFGDHKKKNK